METEPAKIVDSGSYTFAPYVPNNHVAVYAEDAHKPPEAVGKGMRVMAQATQIVPLRVLYGNKNYVPGHRVWIEGACTKLPWADFSHTYRISKNDPEFILVPEDRILLVTSG